MRRSIAAGVLFIGPFAAAGAEPVDRADSIEIAAEHQSLNKDLPDWRETSFRLARAFGPREVLSMNLRRTDRFGLEDSSAGLAYVAPLDPRLVASVEGSFSPTHRVLPRHELGASVQYEFAPAWLLHGGFKTTAYDNTTVNQGLIRLERYVSSFSWSVAWRPTRALGTYAQSLELRGSYYYGNKNSVGLILATGREATAIGEQRVVLADVRTIALIGRHWFDPAWALTYALERTRQGDFYNRSGVRVGVQYSF
ncbi:YaiO family outer membrane beta-barrel protein [Variovorax paradoxus]|nr:YaiO family outer membrane beta-barrel protein [Variovorax paradoxus]